jgi:O-acetyl-ADP-ribose deacetylase (regulator of RNase III)
VHRVKIHQGDIKKLAVDAIVSASASAAQLSELSMAMPATVGDGRSFSASYRTQYSVGDVVIGAADDLPAGMVIYTVGPTWRGGDYDEEQQLASCYHNAMETAKKQNLKSIAFPTISCGASGFPARRAVKIAIREVNQALRQNPLLELVVFGCFDPVTTALYRNHMGK